MQLIDRLKMFMDAEGVTISQFADRCAIPRPTMSQLMNGRNKRVSDEIINKIHTGFPTLSILWLMFGEGDMAPAVKIETSEAQNGAETVGAEAQSVAREEVVVPYGLPRKQTKNGSDNSKEVQGGYVDFLTDLESDEDGLFASGIVDNTTSSTLPGANGARSIRFEADVTESDECSTAASSSASNPVKHPASQTISGDQAKASVSGVFSSNSVKVEESPAGQSKVSISPKQGKKITNIVVFYSDNSFQSFLPEG